MFDVRRSMAASIGPVLCSVFCVLCSPAMDLHYSFSSSTSFAYFCGVLFASGMMIRTMRLRNCVVIFHVSVWFGGGRSVVNASRQDVGSRTFVQKR